jgi:hypothetical protein
MIFQCCRDLHRAFNRRFRIGEKHQRHAVAGRNSEKFTFGLTLAKADGATHDPRQLRHDLTLLGDQQS